MGYTTDFEGSFAITPTPSPEITKYINAFADHRHMVRDPEKVKALFPNWKEQCFNGELGNECEFFVGGTGPFGQDHDDSIINFNSEPGDCPSLWCQWIIENGELCWDGGEKFYEYVDWLKYLIKNFFEPSGYTLNGVVDFQGEEDDDCGKITVVNNKVTMEYTID